MKNIKYTTHVDKKTMLWDIEPYKSTGLPTNAIFHKGRCGIGGTTLEIRAERHSIIVVPTTPPIEGKCNSENGILAVMGEEGLNRDAKIRKIIAKLQSGEPNIKIMTTPDSFECIIQAFMAIDKIEWLYREFFLLLDECHSFITEAFRKNIVIPFRYFWNFKSRCLISATPIVFSDPKFAQLEQHEIIITEKLGIIELIEANDINGVVHFLLSRPDKFPGNVHIFYNSVTQLSERIQNSVKILGKLDCNIFCSKSDKNFKNLGDVSGMFSAKPEDNAYKKFNFYTTRYFEAWDLNDPDATIILITDVNSKHTKVGITNKGVQAIGRLRNKANRIIHFTNHANEDFKRHLDFFKKKHAIYANDTLRGYKAHTKRCKKFKLSPYNKFKDAVENYAEVSEDGYDSKLEIIKIDQWANHDSCNEEYNSMRYIKEAWESCNYDVLLKKVIPSSIPSINNMLVEQQLKFAFERVKELEDNKEQMLFEDDYEKDMSKLKALNANFELAFKAYHIIGNDNVHVIGFNKAKLKKAIYLELEKRIILKVKDELAIKFKGTKYYSNNELKMILQEVYQNVQYRLRNGKIKTAIANQIIHYHCNFTTNKSGYTITEN